MVTRLYLSAVVAVNITPAFAAFTETTNADRREMHPVKDGSALTNKVQAMVATAANSSMLMRQYVSPPMAAQTLAAGTIKGTIRALESAVNDNIDAVRMSLRVINATGTSYNGTAIMVLGNYGPVAEFSTSLRAKRIADGDATTAVTCNEGDRLVLDLGYVTTVGGTSISGTFDFGSASATDLGDNETDTAANNPFLELSIDVIFLPPSRGPRAVRQAVGRAASW